jgi:hypothetical protein
VQGVNQIVPAGRGELAPVFRDDAEVLEQLLQEVVASKQRIADDRHERGPLEPLDDGAAEQRLAGADLAGDNDQRLPPLDCARHLGERGRVGGALEQEAGVRGQAERRLGKSKKPLVAHVAALYCRFRRSSASMFQRRQTV